ncbi:hypothetical protein NX059_000878 [Plenodomus lindquistii]|nr:hypothetical protein NX059_000878 [Plenodomus lindquistii]
MDDYHKQPIWPMMQGTLDYALNIVGEVWTMIWKPTPEPHALPVAAMTEQRAAQEINVLQAVKDAGTTNINEAGGTEARINRGA